MKRYPKAIKDQVLAELAKQIETGVVAPGSYDELVSKYGISKRSLQRIMFRCG